MNPNEFQQNPNPMAAPEPTAQPMPVPVPTAQPAPQAYQPQPYQQQPYQPQAVEPAHPKPEAGLLVLQWLTYAFWGWTLIGLSYLTTMVVSNFVDKVSVGESITYIIAAVLVLLPISFVCDVFYSRKETHKKVGPASAIMVIHAVIFALFAIGSLIVAVFSLVSKFTSDADSAASTIALISSLIIFVYYAVTFIRTIDPAKFPAVRKFYKYFMLGTIGIMIILGVVGPIANERKAKTDRIIENNLSNVSTEISSYAVDKGKLPESLSDLDLSGDNKKLVDQNLVEYKPEGIHKESKYNGYDYSKTIYKYQLCVDYKVKGSGIDYDSNKKDSYSDYLSTYGHEAGPICYKLLTREY